ncbi:hypothetical protein NKH75_23955 [Mesorhizobium sp. M0984]|uniref:hypothetical protein n=1 Tax=Mesorhizobium sp. M0984 TaxID=2957041 RepID=UPI003337ABA5
MAGSAAVPVTEADARKIGFPAQPVSIDPNAHDWRGRYDAPNKRATYALPPEIFAHGVHHQSQRQTRDRARAGDGSSKFTGAMNCEDEALGAPCPPF